MITLGNAVEEEVFLLYWSLFLFAPFLDKVAPPCLSLVEVTWLWQLILASPPSQISVFWFLLFDENEVLG